MDKKQIKVYSELIFGINFFNEIDFVLNDTIKFNECFNYLDYNWHFAFSIESYRGCSTYEPTSVTDRVFKFFWDEN